MADPAGPDLKGQFPVTRAEKWRDAEILRLLRFPFDSGFIFRIFAPPRKKKERRVLHF